MKEDPNVFRDSHKEALPGAYTTVRIYAYHVYRPQVFLLSIHRCPGYRRYQHSQPKCSKKLL